MRFEVSHVLDAIERRLGTDPALAAGVLDVAELIYCADLDGGRPANLVRLGMVVDALARQVGEEHVSAYCVVDKSLLSNQDLTSNERMVMRRWADDGTVEVAVGAAPRVMEISELTGLPIISRALPAVWSPLPGAGGAVLQPRGPVPPGPSPVGRQLTARWWHCPDPECGSFGPARRGSGQPVPRLRNGQPVCARHDAPLGDAGPRPPQQVLAVRIDGVIRTRFVVTAAGPVVVGRAPDGGQGQTGVQLGPWLNEDARAKVSRAHVSVALTQAGISITDLSMNGTLVRLGGAADGELQLSRGASRQLGVSDIVELFPGVEIGRLGALASSRPVDSASVLGEAPTMAFRPNNPGF
ncbi:FHA domain-containing protein [Catellatospora sp. KI3]|uniref:FHA domain-containing protein n=1 Tax=Catellatospora sp. KI3 TaxID=3041620 RepID=UPI002482DE40|nr:FHA domain-containing protein [Catellatospora sp. KI3]MDI1459750.1 FHA domain-containing protein [Catellatospora sp. KI3]